jgi:hypothetical protein
MKVSKSWRRGEAGAIKISSLKKNRNCKIILEISVSGRKKEFKKNVFYTI